MIRVHIVANSDSEADQQRKLAVRDAVTDYLRDAMTRVTSVDEAKHYIKEKLPVIEKIANDTLIRCGVEPSAVVTFCKEAFDIRQYPTFRLPSGIYEALRITIGAGKGKNWWCVAYPTLCVSATGEGFEDVAAGAGFSGGLTGALENRTGYQLRFFLLDCLGKAEKRLLGK